jgi:uncharacterized membrane protein
VELLFSLIEPARSFVLIALGMAVYFLPAILANRRKAKHESGIFWVNFFLGWTMLGWLAVLVWTVAETAPELIPEKCSKSFLGRFVVDVIDRVNRFVPDDKSKGRVQFRAGSNRD